MFDENPTSTAVASWVVISNLLRVLRQKEILTKAEIAQVLQGGLNDLEGDNRTAPREAREFLQKELRSTWAPKRHPTGS
jgi:hypothetical protein